jgi:pimeloyl-ACP methyl ester carboxylesterase
MEETHLPSQPLSQGFNAQAYWSTKPANRVLVLVHGFSGGADTTWRGLPEQLMIHPKEAAGWDMISFGYDSLSLTADESANELHIFLNALFTKTSHVVNRSIDQHDSQYRRAPNEQYTHAIIAGHSLGACVARRALLNQLKSGATVWPVKAKLIWFAPAHGGARITELASAVASLLPGAFGDLVIGGGKYRAPVLFDLERGSDFLSDLLKDTEEFAQQHQALNAPVTFWAPGDKVVFNRPFHKDVTPTIPITASDHISIAKFIGFDVRLGRLLDEMVNWP